MTEKERISEMLFDFASQFEDKEIDEIADSQREEVEQLKELFATKTKETWTTIMAHEITLVNQTEAVSIANRIKRRKASEHSALIRNPAFASQPLNCFFS